MRRKKSSKLVLIVSVTLTFDGSGLGRDFCSENLKGYTKNIDLSVQPCCLNVESNIPKPFNLITNNLTLHLQNTVPRD